MQSVRLVTLALACMFATNTAAQETRKALSKPTPHYPEIAKHMNLSGTVKIEITIGPDGKVKGTNVIGGHPILVDTTLMALKEWRYEPAKTETTVIVTLDFHPNN
jgi:periplasmic protein TonB